MEKILPSSAHFTARNPASSSSSRLAVSIGGSLPAALADRTGAMQLSGNVGAEYRYFLESGSRAELYRNPIILQFYLDAIQFAIGDLQAETLPVESNKLRR